MHQRLQHSGLWCNLFSIQHLAGGQVSGARERNPLLSSLSLFCFLLRFAAWDKVMFNIAIQASEKEFNLFETCLVCILHVMVDRDVLELKWYNHVEKPPCDAWRGSVAALVVWCAVSNYAFTIILTCIDTFCIIIVIIILLFSFYIQRIIPFHTHITS